MFIKKSKEYGICFLINVDPKSYLILQVSWNLVIQLPLRKKVKVVTE